MAATESIAIVRLGVQDTAAGLVLSTEARWNQNEDDWRFFLSKGVVFGVRDDTSRLIASAALLPYSAGNAWISMEAASSLLGCNSRALTLKSRASCAWSVSSATCARLAWYFALSGSYPMASLKCRLAVV